MLYMNEIIKPEYETMDSQWQENVKKEVKMYMDMVAEGEYLQDEPFKPGLYTIYVKKFFESDEWSRIFFEHENGMVYEGFYYFVHWVTGNLYANLNHVEPVCEPDDPGYVSMLNKISSDPAVMFQYEYIP